VDYALISVRDSREIQATGEVTWMQIEALVDARGVVQAKLPAELRGKRVRVDVQAVEEALPTQWDILSRRIDELDALIEPKRTHAEILASLRELRDMTGLDCPLGMR
jgi:hypothetical protein